MKTQEKNLRQSTGGMVTLLTIFSVGTFVLATVFLLTTSITHEIASDRNSRSGVKTFHTAESFALEGKRRYLSAHLHSELYLGDNSIYLNGVPGEIVIIKNWPNDWPYFKVTGNGGDGLTERNVSLKMTQYAEGLAFDYGVFSNNTFSAGGNTKISGNVFANGDVELSGSSLMSGDVFSAGEIEGGHHATGTVATSTVLQIPPPVILEDPYRDEAQTGGTLFADPNDAESYLKNKTRTAVVFIDNSGGDEANIQGTTLSGSLYATGDLRLTSGGAYTATNPYAAIVCDGDLYIAGGVTIHGVVYVRGSTSFGAGNNTINGSLISVGEVSALETSGNTKINYVPMEWQKLAGLSTTTSMELPRMLDWDEE